MNAVIAWVRRSPLLAFFIVVFGVEWLLVLLLAAFTPPLVALMVGSWLPNLVGVLVTGLAGGREGLRGLLSKVIQWQVGIRWYSAAIFIPALLALVTIGFFTWSGAEIPAFAPSSQLLIILIGAAFTGAMGEELGWRGTALPLLQARWSPLLSSLVLGILWGLYHLPSFFLSGLPLQDAPILPFILSATALTVIITWSFNHTRGSLVIVFLYHFSFNLTGNLTGIFASPAAFMVFTWVIILLAALMVALDWRRFTRPFAPPAKRAQEGWLHGYHPQI